MSSLVRVLVLAWGWLVRLGWLKRPAPESEPYTFTTTWGRREPPAREPYEWRQVYRMLPDGTFEPIETETIEVGDE